MDTAEDILSVIKSGSKPDEKKYGEFAKSHRMVWTLLHNSQYDRAAFARYIAGGSETQYFEDVIIAEGVPAAESMLATGNAPDWFSARYPTAADLILTRQKWSEDAFRAYAHRWAATRPKTPFQCAELEGYYLKQILMADRVPDMARQVKEYVTSLARKTPVAASERKGDEIAAGDVAAEMWRHYRQLAGDPLWLAKPYEKRQIDFRVAGYSDFMKKYNVVSRKIIEHGEFSAGAFERYLRRLRTVGYQSRDGWADREADYMLYLWRALNPHGDTRVGQEVWRHTQESLIKEYDSFQSDYKKASQKAKENLQHVSSQNRQDLLLMARRDPAFRDRLLRELQERKGVTPT